MAAADDGPANIPADAFSDLLFIARADFVQTALIPVEDQLFYGLDIAVQEHTTN
jgi:hypothetical protein